MNTALISLELRKNRMTSIGLAASCVLLPPLSYLVAKQKGLDVGVSLQAGMWWWAIVGLPIAAVIFGSSAGAGLRAAAVRDADAPLPASATGRLLRGLTGALIQFVLLILLTAVVGGLVAPGWSRAIFDFNGPATWTSWTHAMMYRGLVAFLAFELIASCYAASYVLGHAVAGGLIGSVFAAAETVPILLCLQYPAFFSDRVESFGPILFLAALAGLAAKAGALKPLAAKAERAAPLGAGGMLGTALLFSAGLLLCWGAEELAYAQLTSSLRLVKPGTASLLLAIGTSTEEAEAALYPAVRSAGALADTVAGGLFWISPDGRVRRLLPDGEKGRFALNEPYRTHVDAAVWDRDGRLLVQRRVTTAAGNKTSFWVGRPQSGVHPVDPELGTAENLLRQGGVLGVGFRKGLESQFCAMDDDGRARTCSQSKTGFGLISLQSQELPLTATIAKDGLTLSRPAPHARTWRLPGRAENLYASARTALAYQVGGKTAYFVPVRIGDEEAVAVCFEDGKIQTLWKHGWSGLSTIGGLQLDVLPDGTLIYQYAYDWNVIDPSGTVLPKIQSKRLFERWPRPVGAPPHTPRLVHRAGGHAWIVFEANRLVEMDESTGMPVKDWTLPVPAEKPGSYDGLRVLEGGLVLQDSESPFFIGWDGAVRSLRAR
ncbi:MAG: hypothetical protein ACHQ51_05715 [Elusimicrobiota bacterium]